MASHSVTRMNNVRTITLACVPASTPLLDLNAPSGMGPSLAAQLRPCQFCPQFQLFYPCEVHRVPLHGLIKGPSAAHQANVCGQKQNFLAPFWAAKLGPTYQPI